MAGKQATWVAVSYTRDTDVVNRLAEIMGRPKAEIRGAVNGLERYSWILVGRDPREPLRVTIPTYVSPKKKNGLLTPTASKHRSVSTQSLRLQ
jgi:hypothetical protein